MHRSNRVQESRMHSPRVHEITQAELSDTRKPLHIWMLQYVEEQIIRNRQEAEDRIVNYLTFVYHLLIRHTSQLCQR